MDFITGFFSAFAAILLESAPWLLLGFFIAGLIKAFFSTAFLHRHLGENSTQAVVKGALLGAPLPLCSCGVIPAALGLKRAGASNAATTSFLIATPETGVDSVSISYALLGPLMAVIRPIAAVTTAIAAGLAVLFVQNRTAKQASATSMAHSCCSSESAENHPSQANNTVETVSSSCCSEKSQPEAKTSACCNTKQKSEAKTTDCCSSKTEAMKSRLSRKILSGLQFTFIDLVRDTSLWLLIGLTMAALILSVIPTDFLATWGSSPYAYIVMALVGVPMYICAVASTPIAAGLLFAGVSPGAILVFLLVGPATNVATLAIVKNELGGRVLAIYLSVIVVISFVFGGITDVITTYWGGMLPVASATHQHTTPLAIVCAIVLVALIANGLRKRYWG